MPRTPILMFKIVLYLYHGDSVRVADIITDLGEQEARIRKALSRMKKKGIIVHHEKERRYSLSPELKETLHTVISTAIQRKMSQVNPNEVIP